MDWWFRHDLLRGVRRLPASLRLRDSFHRVHQPEHIILISTDLPEVIGMSDRVVIMREGYTVLEIDKSEMNQETILAYASGGVSENE